MKILFPVFITIFAANYDDMRPIVEIINEKGGVVTSSELTSRADYKRILHATKKGEVVRLRHGVYATLSSLINNMIDVERIIPNGVVCLYNAWSYHNLSTAVPPTFCIAIESKRKVKLTDTIPINLYYWKKEYFEFGIANYKVSGYNVRMTDLERSVCDSIKYRNKIGVDVCAEVVRNYLRKKERNLSLLLKYANRLRVANVLNKYLEISL